MPDISATRPAAGAPIESAWGGQVHDLLESGGELAYAEITAAVTVSATTEAAANVCITAPTAVVPASGKIWVEGFASAIIPPAVQGSVMTIWLFQDGVSLGRIAQDAGRGAGNQHSAWYARVRLTVAPGSHVYSLRASVASGSGSFYAAGGGPGNSVPSYLRIVAA